MYIETERLIIRSMQPADAQAFIEIASDGSLDEDIFGGWDGAYEELIKEWIAEAMRLDIEDNPKNDYLAYTVTEKISERPVGSVGCSYNDELSEVCMVYFTGSDFRGKGYATEAARAYGNYFLENYDISRILITVRAENIASCKAAEKAGFVLAETKMYKDVNDDKEKLYKFYEMK